MQRRLSKLSKTSFSAAKWEGADRDRGRLVTLANRATLHGGCCETTGLSGAAPANCSPIRSWEHGLQCSL
jgi:hypothetical protein